MSTTTLHAIIITSGGWIGIIHLTSDEEKILKEKGEPYFLEFLSRKYEFSTRENFQYIITPTPDIHYYRYGREY